MSDRLTMRERIFGRLEDRTLTRDNVPAVMLSSPPAGAATPGNAMTIADVYAAVRVLSDAAASLPLHVYRRRADGRERIENRTSELLRHPAPAVVGPNLIGTLMSHLNLWGNAFLGKYRRGGEIVQLGPLAPSAVTVAIENGEPVYVLTHTDSGRQTRHSTTDIIHFRALSTDGVIGLSPVRQCAVALGLSDALSKHARQTFENQAIPLGVLKVGSTVANSPEALASLRAGFEAKHRGTEKAGRVAVLAGEVDYTAVELSPADAELLESRKLSAVEVARALRIPPHMLGAQGGVDSLTYATSETLALDFARYSLAPWLAIVEERLSADRDLFAPSTFCQFSLDGLLRSDAKTRAEIHALSLDPVRGWRTRQEVRQLENLPREQAPPAPTPEQVAGAVVNGNGAAS